MYCFKLNLDIFGLNIPELTEKRYITDKTTQAPGRIAVLSGTTDVKEWHETKNEIVYFCSWSTLFQVRAKTMGLTGAVLTPLNYR